jgi:DNA-binding transcriptional regulator/RsmH inhibitor MraZ
LKNYSGLKKRVVFIGLYDRIEIWDDLEFQKYKKKTELAAGDIAERLKELGV